MTSPLPSGAPMALGAVVDQLWARYAPVLDERIQALAEFHDQLERGGAPDQQAAAAVAHLLAGSLGSFGRAGSSEAAALESLLRQPRRLTPDEVAPYVRALAAAVGPA